MSLKGIMKGTNKFARETALAIGTVLSPFVKGADALNGIINKFTGTKSVEAGPFIDKMKEFGRTR